MGHPRGSAFLGLVRTAERSRASHDAQIYTNDAASLTARLTHDVSKASAVTFSKSQTPSANVVLEQAATLKKASGIGLGLAL